MQSPANNGSHQPVEFGLLVVVRLPRGNQILRMIPAKIAIRLPGIGPDLFTFPLRIPFCISDEQTVLTLRACFCQTPVFYRSCG
jgi:hypothetical protein